MVLFFPVDGRCNVPERKTNQKGLLQNGPRHEPKSDRKSNCNSNDETANSPVSRPPGSLSSTTTSVTFPRRGELSVSPVSCGFYAWICCEQRQQPGDVETRAIAAKDSAHVALVSGREIHDASPLPGKHKNVMHN